MAGTVSGRSRPGFRDGSSAAAGRRSVLSGRRLRGGDFGQFAARPGMFPSARVRWRDDEHLAVDGSHPCPPWESSLVRNARLASGDFGPGPNDVALADAVDHAGAAQQAWASSQALRYKTLDTELVLEVRVRDAVGMGRHQVGGGQNQTVRGSLLARIVPAVTARSKCRRQPAHARRCSLFCAAPIPRGHGRSRGLRRSRPASAFRSARRRRRPSSGNMCWKARRLSGT